MKRIFIVTLISLFLVQFVGLLHSADKTVPMPDLLKPTAIIADGDQLFINDGVLVYIHSLKDFKKRHVFGKKGEGPQEFMIAPKVNKGGLALSVNDDFILASCLFKASFWKRNGEFIRELKTGVLFSDFKPLGKYIVGTARSSKNKSEGLAINLYDSNFKKIKEVYLGGVKKQDKNINLLYTGQRPVFFTYDNKIFTLNRKGGTIEVFDNKGDKLRTIKGDFKKVAVTDGHKKKYLDFFKTAYEYKDYYNVNRNSFVFSDYFPILRDFRVSDNKVYALTFEENKEGKSHLYIFDIQGKFLGSKWVPIKEQSPITLYPFWIHKDQVYKLIEDIEKEEWVLTITRLD
jgi:hypothetical protein